MRQPMAQRLAHFGTSIFTEIGMLAMAHQAVNLGQGFPDFPAPALLKAAAQTAIAAEHNQYAPAPGVLELRAALAQTYHDSYGLDYDPPTEVTITSGATEALFAAAMALINPGDEVIVFEPAYDAYVPDIIMAGGIPRPVLLHPPTDPARPAWRFEPADLVAAVTPRTRVLMINTPHNPTGKVFTRAELTAIATVCQEHDLIAVVDEVYDRLVFTGEHIPLATLPGMRERTVTINSIGKTFSVTGWKIGYACAPAPLTEALRRAHQFITFATATPLQFGAAVAVQDALHSGYYRELQQFYLEQRTLLLAGLTAAGLQVFAPEGAYFVTAALPAGWTDDAAFCRHLITSVGVAAIPVSVFYSQPQQAAQLARFCFAKQRTTLDAAIARLAGLTEAIASGEPSALGSRR